jgi:H/ACA ribonucleoprotein complex subunit 4
MKKDKTYVGIMHLHEDVSEKKLKEEMKEFVGVIKQLPPVRSRVKRQEREREVYKFEIIEKKDKDVLFIAEVEAGTYIRKLIHDLGLKIGGAHMTALRRTKAGIFSESENFVNLYDLEKAVEDYKKGDEKKLREILIPGEAINKIMPAIQIKKESVQRLLTGSPILTSFLKEKKAIKQGFIAAFSDERFIGVYEVRNEGEVIAVPKFVFN